MNDWHCIPFYARCYFFIFQFPHVLRCCVVSETIFKWAIPKYFLSGLLGADITILYTMFAVKHLLSSRHSVLFLELHLWLLEVRWIILRLCEAMTEPIFVQQTQLYRIFIKDFSHFICFGTWRLINLKNFLPIFLFTIFENGELNHIILHFSSFLLIFVSVVLREYHIFVEITFI